MNSFFFNKTFQALSAGFAECMEQMNGVLTIKGKIKIHKAR